METPDPFRGHRIVGGNVALDLLNTQTGPAGAEPEGDVLGDYADLLAWAAHIGVLAADEEQRLARRARRHPDAAAAAFSRARATREYLYRIVDTVARGRQPAAADLERLTHDEAEAVRHARLVRHDDAYAYTWVDDDDLDRPLWPIIHAAHTLMTNGPLDRLKGCPSCRFHFIDESRNRSRRWCSMDDCGAEDKMRTYIAKRATARSARAG
jgi:predicted RNA-binding Zn ribbon-like protein